MKKWLLAALVVVAATLLGATVLREPIAKAAQTVSANIASPLDANGNVMVHEQGTARVRDVDNPAAQPFQDGTPFGFGTGETLKVVTLTQVPAGKRLVIEYASGAFGTLPGQRIISLDVRTVAGGHARQHYLPVEFQGTASAGFAPDRSTAGQDTRLYADPGTSVDASIERSDGTGGGNGSISISGYLVDA